MAKITVACAALSGRIFAGKINKAGTAFLDGKQDVTSDVLKAVIDKIKPGFVETVTVDGAPRSCFEIEIREVCPHGQACAAIGGQVSRDEKCLPYSCTRPLSSLA